MRRQPDPRQLALDTSRPAAASARAELSDHHQVRRKRDRAGEGFTSWPRIGQRVVVEMRGLECGPDRETPVFEAEFLGTHYSATLSTNLGHVRPDDETLSEGLRAFLPARVEVRLGWLRKIKEE